jgi:hypothetical protein
MSQGSLASGPSLPCHCVFEPSRLQEQFQSQAYERIVPETRRGNVAAARTPCRAGDDATESSLSPVSCGGCCA